MLKFFTFLLGKDWSTVQTYRKSSQEKITLFGSVLLIPVSLWIVNGFIMSRQMFDLGYIPSVLTGLFLGFIIFLIERSIILSKTTKTINTLRVILGLIVAVLGSLTMDEIIFEKDIDNIMETYKIETVDKETKKIRDQYLFRIDSISKVVVNKSNIYRQRSDEYFREIEGGASSGVGGIGPIAKTKEILMNRAYEDLTSNQKILNNLEIEYRTITQTVRKDSKENFNTEGILFRMKGLFRLISSDLVTFIVFTLYFLLFLIMETLVIIMKKFTPDSPDEVLEKMGDELFIDKYKKFLDEIREFHYQK